MTPSSVCASCGSGDRAYLITELGCPLCGTCEQRFRPRLVDLQAYRRRRPAGPVPCFTGPQEPAEVLPFPSRQRHQAGAN
jgi:hypothetical protein